jgi:hypothetical protein
MPGAGCGGAVVAFGGPLGYLVGVGAGVDAGLGGAQGA